jgi:hypothetical protein
MRTVWGILFLLLPLDSAIAQTTPDFDDFGTLIDDPSVIDSTTLPDTAQTEILQQTNQDIQVIPDSINRSDTLVAPAQTETPSVREVSTPPAGDSSTLVVPTPQTKTPPAQETPPRDRSGSSTRLPVIFPA